MKKLLYASHGFTLVEVIISIAILSVTSVVALQLFITAQNLNAQSRHSDIASVLATNTIESMKLFHNTEALQSSMEGFTNNGGSFVRILYYDHDFTLLETNNASTAVYEMTSSLTNTDQLGLYEIKVTMVELETEDILAAYTTAHYFNEEVTAYD